MPEVVNNNNNTEAVAADKTTSEPAKENGASESAKKDGLFNFDKLKPEEIKRGETPADIAARCLEVVKSYLGGSWLNATSPEADLTVTRITGGLTNQIYRVQLNDSVPRAETEGSDFASTPTDVAIKFYMAKLIENFNKEDGERLSDTIVLTILSEKGLGPKVYGIFKDGYVQEYVDHVIFGPEHQKQPAMLRKLAHMLAQVHSLQVPIRKKHSSFIDLSGTHLEGVLSDDRADKLIEKNKLKVLTTAKVKAEFEELCRRVEAAKVKTVFCYNDFRGSNILVSKTEPGKILFTDLEYAAYGPRGVDICIYMHEWGKPSLSDMENRALAPEDVIRNFLSLYLEGADLVTPGYSQRPGNGVEDILREVKIATLQMGLFGALMSMNMRKSIIDIIPFDENVMMQYAEKAFEKYLEMKEKYINEGVL